MKKVAIVFVSILFGSHGLFAQPEPAREEKKLTYGFNIGLNYSNLMAREPLQNKAEISNGPGFRLGLLLDYSINKNISLSPKAELSFNDSKVIFNNANRVVTEIMPVSFDFMAHLVFRKGEGSLKPYFLAGPNFKVPLEGRGTTTDFGNNADLAIDFGVGLESIMNFVLAPEIRYSYGLLDINRNPALAPLNFHNISLVINFRGK